MSGKGTNSPLWDSSMDRLKHFRHNFDFEFGNNRENIAVEMDNAALVFGIREHFSHCLQHSHTLVANNEFHTVQAASTRPLEEADPTGLILFHSFSSS